MSALRRLLCFDQFGEFGGGQAILGDVVAGAIADGVEVHVALPSGPFADELDRRGAQVHALALPPLHWHRKTVTDAARFVSSVPTLVAATERIMDLVRPDLVHVNGGRVLLPVAVALGKRPLTFHAHTAYADGPSRRSMRWALRRSRCRAVITPSPFMRRWAHEALGITPERLAMIWNWVDDRFFCAVRPNATGGAPTRRIVVLGRITPVKGQDVALTAFKMLPKDLGRELTLTICGPADNEAAGKPFVRQLRADAAGDARISIRPGFVDSRAVLETADLCVVPSRFDETFGLVAAEAMAAGVPVVVSDRGALPQVVGSAGLVVPAGDAAALRAVLEPLLRDAERGLALAGAGRRRAQAQFVRERQVGAVLRVFRAAVEGGSS